jgi:hypothetical protein
MNPWDSTPEELEGAAWAWLLSLPRIEGDYRRMTRQVIISALPGALCAASGAPGVSVSLDLGDGQRIRRSANSLSEAVGKLHHEFADRLPPLPDSLVYVKCAGLKRQAPRP